MANGVVKRNFEKSQWLKFGIKDKRWSERKVTLNSDWLRAPQRSLATFYASVNGWISYLLRCFALRRLWVYPPGGFKPQMIFLPLNWRVGIKSICLNGHNKLNLCFYNSQAPAVILEKFFETHVRNVKCPTCGRYFRGGFYLFPTDDVILYILSE